MEERRLRMKRILMVLAAAALMVAMVVASALPAFADKGGIRGHTKQETSGACTTRDDCQITTTIAGGGPHGNLSGRITSTKTFGTQGPQTHSYETQGGSRYLGGGNCSEQNNTISGSGNRCN
jgi:hypothetical protein